MRFLLTVAAVMTTISPGAVGHATAPQAAPPATEVFLAPLTRAAGPPGAPGHPDGRSSPT